MCFPCSGELTTTLSKGPAIDSLLAVGALWFTMSVGAPIYLHSTQVRRRRNPNTQKNKEPRTKTRVDVKLEQRGTASHTSNISHAQNAKDVHQICLHVNSNLVEIKRHHATVCFICVPYSVKYVTVDKCGKTLISASSSRSSSFEEDTPSPSPSPSPSPPSSLVSASSFPHQHHHHQQQHQHSHQQSSVQRTSTRIFT